jgi:Protein of unknown function (DUF4238)
MVNSKGGSSKQRFSPPDWKKKLHHVVPVSWQKRFSAPAYPGCPFYKCVVNGRTSGPIGPGTKMAVQFGNILFDKKGFPIDQLEDRLAREETKLTPVLDRVLSTGRIEQANRPDISRLLAIQACRYPEVFRERLDPGKLLAIELLKIKDFTDAAHFNLHLQRNPKYAAASTSISQHEFSHLASLTCEQLKEAIEYLVNDHFQSEEGLNPNSVIDGADPIGVWLAKLEWILLESAQPSFILSDRPVPLSLMEPFSLGLGARYALMVNTNSAASVGPVTARPANQNEVDAVNQEVKGRAKVWLCGPIPF